MVEKEARKMPIRYKIDVLEELKAKGYNTNKIRKEKLIGEAMLQKIRQRQVVSWATIETLCRLLECDVGDIVEYSAETAEPTEESLTDN